MFLYPAGVNSKKAKKKKQKAKKAAIPKVPKLTKQEKAIRTLAKNRKKRAGAKKRRTATPEARANAALKKSVRNTNRLEKSKQKEMEELQARTCAFCKKVFKKKGKSVMKHSEMCKQ